MEKKPGANVPNFLLRLSPNGDKVFLNHRYLTQIVDSRTWKVIANLLPKKTPLFRLIDLAWLETEPKLLGLVTSPKKRGIPGSKETIFL